VRIYITSSCCCYYIWPSGGFIISTEFLSVNRLNICIVGGYAWFLFISSHIGSLW
jgi:hypothetical protein